MGKKRYKEHAKGRRKRFRRYRQSVLLVSTAVVFLSIILFFQSMTLQVRNQEYKRQEAELESQIEEEKERSEEIGAYQEYVKTDEYVREVAKEKLGLVDQDEILFKPSE